MKKIINIFLLLIAAFIFLFAIVSVMNMMQKGVDSGTIIYGTGISLIVIALLVFFVVLIDRSEKNK
ncbi:MAG: hypothetical protein J6A16_03980 [Oscillospiraceae bacterium]|nr:hypothetical protein [Oscillospiraceae bacterium]